MVYHVSMSVTELDDDLFDSAIEERRGREKDNSQLLAALAAWLYERREKLGIEVFISQRIKVSAYRFRIPDLCVTIGLPDEQIFTTPPFLCIEILSPEDQMRRVLAKIADYLEFGVRYVWLIDPRKQTAIAYTANEALPVSDGVLRTQNPDLAVPLSELF